MLNNITRRASYKITGYATRLNKRITEPDYVRLMNRLRRERDHQRKAVHTNRLKMNLVLKK